MAPTDPHFSLTGQQPGANKPMNLAIIQEYLRSNRIDGWLLYDFRGSNPIALHVAGLQTSGSRRWFLWIPAHGDPVWLIHAIERGTVVATCAPASPRGDAHLRRLAPTGGDAAGADPRRGAHRHGVQPGERHSLT
jgi:hypothetical protein